ncbi:hypothetical protein [Flavobacterium humidisoli]|uniref:Anti-bacteriophage protein A/HamA C-terminal domain-containing protein n=1 Tax=Flavobacterium humidisoli TaxID=2937442 RepID=A0ABY4LYE0_9FLAO|nr:hypothetical protein [Flavobacterium humidisoli]UPZ17807.1 hypothetical protein M0M44_10755 [Flavobacterium humidisoli]
MKKYIENNLHFIWNGDNEEIESIEDLKVTKQELINLIENKSAVQKIGIVAEFICHLYLRSNNFKQHFLFRNLEEKGMKKGFDGLYLQNDLYFVYESKSSLESTMDSTHNGNISEAYNDLKKKIEGTNAVNDPWRNAYNHSVHRSVNFNENISKTLKKLSQDYVQKKFSKIDNYNIIPSSTIYLGARFATIDKDDLKVRIESLTKDYKFQKIDVLCINKNSIQQFINYLNE